MQPAGSAASRASSNRPAGGAYFPGSDVQFLIEALEGEVDPEHCHILAKQHAHAVEVTRPRRFNHNGSWLTPIRY